jgi:hypothetical protein
MTHRKGFCWLCTHPVTQVACANCGCLAHYPPWPPAPQRVPCHVVGCVDHVDGMHVDGLDDAIWHIGCQFCAGGTYRVIPASTGSAS